MQKLFTLILILLSIFNISAQNSAESDSILKNVMIASEKHSKLVENYNAEVYLRTYIRTIKKNILHKYTHLIPDFVLYDRKNDQAMIETYSILDFKFPSNYEHIIKNVNGTLSSKKDVLMIPYNFLNINVYNAKTADERFILPIRFETQKYYRHKLKKIEKGNNTTYYTFEFSPIYSSSKLLRGSFVVEDKSWRIIRFTGIGNELFVDFKIDIFMGNKGLESFLPVEFQIYRTHSYLGNKVQNRYLATIRYKNAEMRLDTTLKKTYNIGETHKVKLDSIPSNADTLFWNYVRTIPLDGNEQILNEKIKTSKITPDTAVSKNKTMQIIAQSFITDTRYHYKKTDINYSGFLNPGMLSYSTKDGLNYRIRLSFKTHLQHDKNFSISSYAGYATKYRDLVANFSTNFSYNPGRLGKISLSAGKGNQSFSNLFIQEIQDSLTSKGLNFRDLYVNYFKDYYARIFNNIEITNGFQVGTGIEYHIRQATQIEINANNDENHLKTRRYFVPALRLTYTPKQFYRKDGYEKIYVSSYFPTFKAEFAKSFKNILGSTSEYNKVEFDMNQNISIGLLQNLQYHIGAGFYARQQTEFFADFTYFARYNLPETWDDGIGGVFNVLPYSVYNASTSYAQAHIMYETPFFIFTLLPKLARGVLSERIYLSQLYTPYILSYTEIGYGIGNRFVNAAVFGSFHKFTFQQIGGTVVFLLGK